MQRLVLTFILALSAGAFAVGTALAAELPKAELMGAKKCKMCHKKADVGAQYLKWTETAHAQAYETLATDQAKKYAVERGIEGSPQEATECMKCHSTAWGMSAEALKASKITIEEGVSCESCHGAGSLYYKKKTMKAIAAGTVDRASVGLTLPTEEVCLQCHNDESPGFDGFDFEESFKKVAHPRPDDTKK